MSFKYKKLKSFFVEIFNIKGSKFLRQKTYKLKIKQINY